MSFGIIEVISLLLGLSGFGLQPNPKAPTADQSLQYAMPDPDVVVHFDAASVIPGNYKVLTNLPNQPQIKSSPELSKMVRGFIGEIEGARGLAKTTTGIDFATDLNDATVFLQFVPKHEPAFVAVVHGKFSSALIEKVAKLGKGTVQKTNAGMMLDLGPDQPSLAVTKDGVLVAGTAALVHDRMADGWKSPAHGAGTTLGYAADVINAQPVYAVVLTMSLAARKEALANIKGQNFATDLIQRHKMAAISVFHDGIGWTWIDSTKAGMESMGQMSEGLMDLLKAAQIAPRGFAKIVLGAIDSYKGVDKRVDELIAHKGDVMKIVESYTGDGNFKVQIDRDAKANKLTVRATGKTVSEVVPAGFLVPMAVLGAVVMRSNAMPMPPPAQIVAPPARPGSLQKPLVQKTPAGASKSP